VHGRTWVGGVVVGAIVLGWWWWPSLVDRGPTNDVLVVADGDLIESATPVARRLRERGLSVIEDHSLTSWCAASEALNRLIDDVQPSTVVLSFRAQGDCANGVREAVDAVGSRRAIVVIQPGLGRQDQAVSDAIADLQASNIVIADPSSLLGGDEMPTIVGCQWWDDCTADGTVEIRDATGVLTTAGAERVARVLVSATG
jgi:hypothetical protein